MNFIKKAAATIAVLAIVFGIVGSAKALDLRTHQSINIKKGDQISDEMLLAAGEINIQGQTFDDLIGAAETATISGKIDGNLNLAAGTINLNGEVTQDARLVGGTIKITGKVDKNLMVVGGTIEIADTAIIQGDVVVYGGTFKVYGNIKGDLRYSGGSTFIAGTAEKNVRLNSPEITIAENAHIIGDLNYTSTNAATIQNGAKIDGQSFFRLSQKQDVFAQKSIGYAIISGLAYILLALIILFLLPLRVIGIADTLRNNFWASVLAGVIALIVIPVCVLLLLITVIGAPTAVVLLALYFLAIYLAKIFIAALVGKFILSLVEKKKAPNIPLATIIGLILILIATNIPYIGYAISLIITILGLGAILVYLYYLRKAGKAFKLI
jgi:cytoskeletal protein CcmA (bactofilin family)